MRTNNTIDGYVEPGVGTSRQALVPGHSEGIRYAGPPHPPALDIADLGAAGAALANAELAKVCAERDKLALRVKELEASITAALAYVAKSPDINSRDIIDILDRRGER